ncbi:MAG: type II toxin-antitoxin system PemK/MazF family toxin [Acidobacteriota bacterium]|jgi:mRNA interferase MazF
MVIVRGQIFWCGLDPVQGHEQGALRPVIIISADTYNLSRSPLVAVVPLTRAPAKNPLHLEFSTKQTGLDAPSTALVDRARFLDRRRLQGAPIGHLAAEALSRLDHHLARVFGLAC